MAANDDLSETSLIKYIQINGREHGRNNPEKMATLGTQDTGRRQTTTKTRHYTQTNSNNVNKTSYNWST
jgi:hypothetical protein